MCSPANYRNLRHEHTSIVTKMAAAAAAARRQYSSSMRRPITAVSGQSSAIRFEPSASDLSTGTELYWYQSPVQTYRPPCYTVEAYSLYDLDKKVLFCKVVLILRCILDNVQVLRSCNSLTVWRMFPCILHLENFYGRPLYNRERQLLFYVEFFPNQLSPRSLNRFSRNFDTRRSYIGNRTVLSEFSKVPLKRNLETKIIFVKIFGHSTTILRWYSLMRKDVANIKTASNTNGRWLFCTKLDWTFTFAFDWPHGNENVVIWTESWR